MKLPLGFFAENVFTNELVLSTHFGMFRKAGLKSFLRLYKIFSKIPKFIKILRTW